MALNAYALTNVDRLKTFLKISGSSNDDSLELFINLATDVIELHCGRRFKKTAYTDEIYDGNDSPDLQLKNFPVDSSAEFSISQRQGLGSENSYDSLDSDYYVVDYVNGIISITTRKANAYLSGRSKFYNIPGYYKVTYTAGYDFNVNDGVYLADIGQGALETAVFQMAKELFTTRKVSSSVKSERIRDYAITYGDVQMALMNEGIISLLANYRSYA